MRNHRRLGVQKYLLEKWPGRWPRLALGFGLSPQGRPPLNLQGALPGGGLLGTSWMTQHPGPSQVWAESAHGEAHLIWSTSWGSAQGEPCLQFVWDCEPVLGVSGPSEHTEGLWMRQGAGRAHRPEGPLASTLCRLARSHTQPSPAEAQCVGTRAEAGWAGAPRATRAYTCLNLLWKTLKTVADLSLEVYPVLPLPNIGKNNSFLQVHQSRKEVHFPWSGVISSNSAGQPPGLCIGPGPCLLTTLLTCLDKLLASKTGCSVRHAFRHLSVTSGTFCS